MSLSKRWAVFLDVYESDKLINVPIAKHHNLAKFTLGMKNLYGAIGGKRNRLHQHIHSGIVDLAAFFKPTLTIIDAIRILKTKWSHQGRDSFLWVIGSGNREKGLPNLFGFQTNIPRFGQAWIYFNGLSDFLLSEH